MEVKITGLKMLALILWSLSCYLWGAVIATWASKTKEKRGKK